MSVIAKLHLDGKEYNILEYRVHFHQERDFTGKPAGRVEGGLIHIVIEAIADTIFHHWGLAPEMMKDMEIVFSPVTFVSKSRTIKLYDVYLSRIMSSFSSTTSEPMTYTLLASPGIFVDGDVIFKKPWHVTDLSALNAAPTPEPQLPKPMIISVHWADEDDTERKEIHYGGKVSLQIEIANKKGATVEISIAKESGEEISPGVSKMTFKEPVNEEGLATLTSFIIREKWEEFKGSNNDTLIATVSYEGKIKKSNKLEIIPSPKVMADFRPHDGWKGEFGFDWMRIGDTKLFGDNNYEDVISKQYTDGTYKTLEKNGNTYKGKFKKDSKQFKLLQKKYKSFSFPWAKVDSNGKKSPEDYLIPWMSMYKNQGAKVKLILDIQEKGDYLEFENNPNFSITPNTIDISSKTGTVKLKDVITIKCLTEFASDETIVIKACQKDAKGNVKAIEAGKITVWANDAVKQKEKKVVFVQIKTPPLSTKFELAANTKNEKDRIEKYLKQALIELDKDSDIVDLDLSTNKEFEDFIKSKKVSSKSAKDKSALDKFLTEQLSDVFKKKYDNHFKAFYFAENGYHSSGLLSGYSRFGADFVVVFASANDQTAAHEFLHSMNLAHSFSNSEASRHAEFTYEYKKTENLLDYTHHITGHENDRCSLWYWQWVKANNSIK